MKYVLTGGPNSGKTTLIEELKKLGFSVLGESAREIVEREQATGGSTLPWADWKSFQIRILETQLMKEAAVKTPTFLDRGLMDGLAYYFLNDVRPPAELVNACRHAGYKKVFWLDMLPDFGNDAVRKEDLETALKLSGLTLKAYQMFGYEPVKVPILPLVERARLVAGMAGLTKFIL
jgi:predicted ATPase